MASANTSTLDRAMDCNQLPDACTNEEREETLIQRQRQDDERTTFQRVAERDRSLIFACFALIVCMNFLEGRYLLYPFRILSTFVHEMCHAIAALLVGGRVDKLYIYADGSGLAYTYTQGAWRQAFVAAGGYPGTAVTGCIMLLFRRTVLGPTIGVCGLGGLMCLSVLVWVRNRFGVFALTIEGVALLWCGWKLPAYYLDHLFNFIAATCCLNAVQSIHDLFGSNQFYAGGRVVTNTDAHTVAKYWVGGYLFWASLWFMWSLGLTVFGIYFARDARELSVRFGNKAPIKAQITENNGINNNAYYAAPSVVQTAVVERAPNQQYYASAV